MVGDCAAESISSASSGISGQGSDHGQSSPRLLGSQASQADFFPSSQDCDSDAGLDGGLSPDDLPMDPDGSMSWQIGLNTGAYVDPALKTGEQILIANVVHNLGCIRDRHLKKASGLRLGSTVRLVSNKFIVGRFPSPLAY